MSLFDLFSGSSGRRAGMAATAQLQQQQAAANNALQQSTADAMPLYNRGILAFQEANAQGRQDLTNGYNQQQGYLGRATDSWDPYLQMARRGADAYGNAVGLNGMGAAQDAFRATPGYEFARGEAEQGVLRNAAARGQLAGGNTTADLAARLTGLADQTYGNYVSRLQPYLGMYGQGTAGLSGALTNQGSAAAGQGAALSNLGLNSATGQANMLGQQAGAIRSMGQNQAQLAGQFAGPISNALTGSMTAGQQGSQNAWSAIFGGLNLGANLLGRGGGMPSFSSLFGGGSYPTMAQGGYGPDMPPGF